MAAGFELGWLEKSLSYLFCSSGNHLVLIISSFHLKARSVKFLKFDEKIIIKVDSLVVRHWSLVSKIWIGAEKYGAINYCNRMPCSATLPLSWA